MHFLKQIGLLTVANMTFCSLALASNKDVIISEILSHTDGVNDAIEIYNSGDDSVSLKGWKLKEPGNTYNFSNNDSISPGQYKCYDSDTLGFNLSAKGQEVELKSDKNYQQTIAYRTSLGNTSLGRVVSSGKGYYVEMNAFTLGRPNSAIQTSLTMSEVMYHPSDDLYEYL